MIDIGALHKIKRSIWYSEVTEIQRQEAQQEFAVLCGEIEVLQQELLQLREVHRTVNDFRKLILGGMPPTPKSGQ